MLRLLLLAGTAASLWLAGNLHAPITASPTSLSQRIVAPGGGSPLLPRERIEAALARLPTRSGHVDGAGGVPIFWRALDPADYRMHYRYLSAGDGRPAGFELDFETPQARAHEPARGTVVLLHGWMMDGDSLLPWSLQLAQQGYRSIGLDLRNHGRSGAGMAGYGTREADDVGAAIAGLRQRGEIEGPLYLFGVSYGAATALFANSRPGSGIAGVVALESFANAGRGIRDMVPHMLSRPPAGLKERAALQLARWRYGGQDMDAVIAASNRQLGLDLDRIDVGAALAVAQAPVLLLHGSADGHIPVAHGRRLAAAAAHACYRELPGEDHISLPMRLDLLSPMVVGWLEAVGAGHAPPCPGSTAAA